MALRDKQKKKIVRRTLERNVAAGQQQGLTAPKSKAADGKFFAYNLPADGGMFIFTISKKKRQQLVN
jgi:hypothetical protein